MRVFFYSNALVKREQELHESWWELISESLLFPFSHALDRKSLKIRIKALKIRIKALKIRIKALKIRIQALKIRIQALKLRIQAIKIRIQACPWSSMLSLICKYATQMSFTNIL